jgi:hypothetical protein
MEDAEERKTSRSSSAREAVAEEEEAEAIAIASFCRAVEEHKKQTRLLSESPSPP